MSSDKNENEDRPEGDGTHPQGTRKRHFRGYWNMENTKPWVEMFAVKRMSAVAIANAKEVDADPSTVTTWLRRHGVEVYAGLHRVDREPPKVSAELAALLAKGPEEVMKFLDERVWGIFASPDGTEQLTNYCKFLKLPLTMGVKEVAAELNVHRSTILKWTQGTDQSYLVHAANTALHNAIRPNCKLLPMRLIAGGNKQEGWIQVPNSIRSYQDILEVLRQIQPLETTYNRAQEYGISKETIESMRAELLSYALAMALGDSGKEGGAARALHFRQPRPGPFEAASIEREPRRVHVYLRQQPGNRDGTNQGQTSDRGHTRSRTSLGRLPMDL